MRYNGMNTNKSEGWSVQRKERTRLAVLAFFMAFCLLGLLTAGDYGPCWDEQDEMDILRMNLWEYARALHLEESAFEKRAREGNGLTISALTPISQSIEQDHGIAAFYPLAGVVMSESLSENARSLWWHMGCWTLFTLGGFALYAAGREMGLSRLFALLGPVMLLLSPRFFAQGHYNNKDIAFMALVLCLLWTALRLMRRPSLGNGLWFAMCGALAANTKVAGWALFGLCGVMALAQLALQKRLTGRVWAVGGASLAAFVGLYALLTPALWQSPVAFVRYLVDNALAFQRWHNWVLFRGVVFKLAQQPLPWYYLPYMLLATTPLWVLLLLAIGVVWAVRALLSHRKDLKLLLLLLAAFLPLLFAVLTRTTVYNGWRHFYFVYGPMLLLAACGASAFWRAAKPFSARRRMLAAGLCVCMALTGVGEITQHPHQQAYEQPLARLLKADNEMDYWNVSVREALEALAAQVEGSFAVAGCDLWAADGLQKAVFTLPEALQSRFTVVEGPADYVLVNPTYARFSGYVPPDTQPLVELLSYGRPIMTIYPEGASKP